LLIVFELPALMTSAS